MNFNWRWNRLSERIATLIAWKMPKKIAYWCFIRVATHANRNAPDVAILDAMKAWD